MEYREELFGFYGFKKGSINRKHTDHDALLHLLRPHRFVSLLLYSALRLWILYHRTSVFIHKTSSCLPKLKNHAHGTVHIDIFYQQPVVCPPDHHYNHSGDRLSFLLFSQSF